MIVWCRLLCRAWLLVLATPVFSFAQYIPTFDTATQAPPYGLPSHSIAADSNGNVFVIASTAATYSQASDIRLTKLDATGMLVFSQEIGGSEDDTPVAVAVDAAGNAYVTGFTESSDFPQTAAPLLTNPESSGSMFLIKFGSGGPLIYSLLLGPLNPRAMTIDNSGNIYIAGTGFGVAFPAGAYSTSATKNSVFVLKISAGVPGILLGSYLGGTTLICQQDNNCPVITPIGINFPPQQEADAIAIDSSGAIYLTGITEFADFPVTPGALRTMCDCPAENDTNAFVAKFNADASTLLYSTLLGPPLTYTDAIAVDSTGSAYVGGETTVGFPITFATNDVAPSAGNGFGFITKLNESGTAQQFGTVLPGPPTLGASSVDSIQLVESAAGTTVIFQAVNYLGPAVCNAPITGPNLIASIGPDGNSIASCQTFPRLFGDAGFALLPNQGLALAGSQGMISDLSPQSGSSSAALINLTDSATLSARAHVAPGELITLFGQGLAAAGSTGAITSPENGSYPTQVANGGITSQVFFDGVPAPLLYVSSTQINAVVPYEIAGRETSQLEIAGLTIASYPVQVAAADPQVFTDGLGQALVFNQDGSRNTSSNPALPGSIATIYASAAGVMVNPPGTTGMVTTTLSAPELPVIVFLGSNPRATLSDFSLAESATIAYAGAAPEQISGMMQVNFVVPSGAGPYVFLIVGSAISDGAMIYTQ